MEGGALGFTPVYAVGIFRISGGGELGIFRDV